jgi:branched-chain amino acid transport system substrate-binding protein
MEQLTKRILAIVLIAVIGVAIGFTVWIFVAPYVWTALDVPGLENRTDITEDQIIRIGALGDLKDIQGIGNRQGAYLAAYEINTQQNGIVVGGKRYYIGLTAEDTDEVNPNFVAADGISAAERLVFYKNVQFLVGGFRTEATLQYYEVAMENSIPFINTGCATDTFTQRVGWDYNRYKYYFRVMPINSSSLAQEIGQFFLYNLYVWNYVMMLNVSKIAFIREDLDWTANMVPLFKYVLTDLGPGSGNGIKNCTVTGEYAYDINTVNDEVMAGFWNEIKTDGAHITIPMISAQGGLPMMRAYNTTKPQSLVFGIDVMSQVDTYWAQTGGACNYEITMLPAYNVSKTSRTIPFWNNYYNNFSGAPCYTACGAYDAIYALARAINRSQSFNADTIVDELENINVGDPLVGAFGNLAFTPASLGTSLETSGGHDVQEGHPYGYTLFVQWLADGSGGGTFESLPAGWGLPPPLDALNLYPPSLATVPSIVYPPWFTSWGA